MPVHVWYLAHTCSTFSSFFSSLSDCSSTMLAESVAGSGPVWLPNQLLPTTATSPWVEAVAAPVRLLTAILFCLNRGLSDDIVAVTATAADDEVGGVAASTGIGKRRGMEAGTLPNCKGTAFCSDVLDSTSRSFAGRVAGGAGVEAAFPSVTTSGEGSETAELVDALAVVSSFGTVASSTGVRVAPTAALGLTALGALCD